MMANSVVLITGASGFIGSRLAHYLVKATHVNVVGTYLTNEIVRVEGVDYHRLNVVDGSCVRNLICKTEPDVVLHIAGTKDISFCAEHPRQAWLVHAKGTQNVVDARKMYYIRYAGESDGTIRD